MSELEVALNRCCAAFYGLSRPEDTRWAIVDVYVTKPGEINLNAGSSDGKELGVYARWKRKQEPASARLHRTWVRLLISEWF